MSEYDNTNSGILFQPFQDQKLTGQGRLNVEGVDHKIVAVMEPLTKGGAPEFVLYARIGPLFRNEKTDNDAAPQRSGPCDLFPGKRVAAWMKEKDNRKFFSRAISDRQQPQSASTASSDPFADTSDIAEDEIPW